MSEDIQGLTVKVGITDEAFTGGISKINKAMSLLQSEFKASSEGLKGFGDTSQQLNNKSEYLNKAIELQQQKVKALQEAYSKSKQETGEFSNSTMAAGTKVNNAVAQLAKLQNELKQVDEELSNSGKQVEEEGNVWDKFSSKLKYATSGMGEYIKRGIGLAIGGDIWNKAKEGFSSVISFGGDAQKALNGIQAATGYSQESMAGFRDVMVGIYNDNFGEGFDDIAESITAVSQQTGETGDSLKGLTEDALLLRDTFGYEVNESVRSAATLMKQFGITGDEAFNLIAEGKQQGLDFSGEMLDSINEYSVQFKKLGLDAEDMFNIFYDGSTDGAFNLDKIGDAVKEFSIRAIDGSKTTQDGFKQLGFSADDISTKFAAGGNSAKDAFTQVTEALANVDDPVKQSTIGVELFGTMWEDLGPKVITQLGNIGDNFNKTTDVMNQMNNVKYNDLGSAFEGIKRNIQTGLLLPISNEVLPKLSDFSNWFVSNLPTIKDKFTDLTKVVLDMGSGIADTVKPIFEGLFNFIGEHGDATKVIILGIGTAFLTFSTVAGIINGITAAMELWNKALVIQESLKKIVQVIKEWEIVTKLQTAAQAALNFVMDANLIGIIILAIAALVGGIVLAYNKCEWFRNGVNAIGEWLKNFFTVTLPQAFNSVVAWFISLPAKATALWTSIKTSFTNGWNAVVNFFTIGVPTFFSNLWITIKTACTTGWNTVATFFTTTIPAWIASIGEWFAELPNKIMYGLGSLVGLLATWGVNVWDYFSTNVPIWINNVVTFFSELPGKIWTFLVDVVTKLGEWGGNVISWIATNVITWITNIVTFYSELPGKIWEFLVAVVTKLGEWGSNVVSWISTNVSAWVTNIVTFFSQLPEKIWTWLVNCVTNITTWGSNMLTEASTGMQNVFNGIVDTFTNLPSKMMDIGENIVAGIKDGIKNAWDGLTGWIGGLCDSFTQGVKDKFEIHSPSHIFRDEIGKMLAQGIGVGFDQEMPQINTNIGRTIDGTVKITNLSNLKSVDSAYLNDNQKQTTSSSVLEKILEKMDRLEKALDIKLDGQSVVEKIADPLSERVAFNMSRGI